MMVHPYRSPPASGHQASERREPGCDDERALGVTLVGLAGLRLLVAVLCHQTFGAEPTVAVFLAIVGLPLLRRR